MMPLLREIAAGLTGMFMADARLTLAILALVAIVAGLILALGVDPLIGGGALLAGCHLILVEAALREARRRRPVPEGAQRTQAIRNRLVEPGVPNGTPAVITRLEPALAMPLWTAKRQARSTMSSMFWASSQTTACRPQSSASRRAVPNWVISARIGRSGSLARRPERGRAGGRVGHDRGRAHGARDLRAPRA